MNSEGDIRERLARLESASGYMSTMLGQHDHRIAQNDQRATQNEQSIRLLITEKCDLQSAVSTHTKRLARLDRYLDRTSVILAVAKYFGAGVALLFAFGGKVSFDALEVAKSFFGF